MCAVFLYITSNCHFWVTWLIFKIYIFLYSLDQMGMSNFISVCCNVRVLNVEPLPFVLIYGVTPAGRNNSVVMFLVSRKWLTFLVDFLVTLGISICRRFCEISAMLLCLINAFFLLKMERKSQSTLNTG